MKDMIVSNSDDEQPIEHAEVRLIEDTVPILSSLKHGSNILAIVMSLVQNQAISIVSTMMGIGKINFIISIMFGLLIGQISYVLAKRSYKEIEYRSRMTIPHMLSFIKDFMVAMESLKYSLFLNLGFLCIAFLVQRLLTN